MATVANKIFKNEYDAHCSDGTDPEKMTAIYDKVLDTDGFQYDKVHIPATVHNSGDDAAIVAALETAIS